MGHVMMRGMSLPQVQINDTTQAQYTSRLQSAWYAANHTEMPQHGRHAGSRNTTAQL
jgi:hypothetical protein